MKAYLSNKDYKFIYSRVPRLCVDLVIFSREGIVFSKRDIPPYRGQWHLPGGRVFMRESIQKAIDRIVLVELDIEVSQPKLLGYIEYPREQKVFHSISMVFKVQKKSGEIRGSFQAQKVKVLKKIPNNTILPQRRFLESL